MNVSDIMVGDWVYVKHLNKIGKVYRIDAANGSKNGFVALLDGDFSYNDIEPIPLTSDILKNNGFAYDNNLDIWETYVGEIKITVGIYHPDFIIIGYEYHTPNGVESGDLSNIVKSDGSNICVHDLQHALKLCCVEKEIEL